MLARPPHRAYHPNSTPLHYCISAPHNYARNKECHRSDGTKQRQQGCMVARHRRAHRAVSLVSDDISDGMLPVRMLSLKVLQTGAGHRRMPRGERALSAALTMLH